MQFFGVDDDAPKAAKMPAAAEAMGSLPVEVRKQKNQEMFSKVHVPRATFQSFLAFAAKACERAQSSTTYEAADANILRHAGLPGAVVNHYFQKYFLKVKEAD